MSDVPETKLQSYVSLINMGGDNCGMGLAADYPPDFEDDATVSRADDTEWYPKDQVDAMLGSISAPEPERKSLDQLADELEAASKQWHNAEIQHVKSGSRYRIVGFHFRESDMALCVEYCLLDGLKEIGSHPAAGTICTARVKFARSVSEMAFGSRFIFCGGTLQ